VFGPTMTASDGSRTSRRLGTTHTPARTIGAPFPLPARCHLRFPSLARKAYALLIADLADYLQWFALLPRVGAPSQLGITRAISNLSRKSQVGTKVNENDLEVKVAPSLKTKISNKFNDNRPSA
jgi:hypothetical protein